MTELERNSFGPKFDSLKNQKLVILEDFSRGLLNGESFKLSEPQALAAKYTYLSQIKIGSAKQKDILDEITTKINESREAYLRPNNLAAIFKSNSNTLPIYKKLFSRVSQGYYQLSMKSSQIIVVPLNFGESFHKYLSKYTPAL